MTYLTIAWVLLTLPVFAYGGAFYQAKQSVEEPVTTIVASVVTFVPLWWGIYFLIRWGVQ